MLRGVMLQLKPKPMPELLMHLVHKVLTLLQQVRYHKAKMHVHQPRYQDLLALAMFVNLSIKYCHSEY